MKKKFQIVVDSSSDLLNSYITDENILFNVVPLTIKVGEKEFIDDENIDVENMLKEMHAYKEKSTSSCPSTGSFEEIFKLAENTICITIGSKLSGTYNAARLAGDMIDENVHVIDSKLTSGALVLIVDKCYELMKQDLSFEEIVKQLNEYTETRNLLFVLDKFDNLVKNGRMSKVSGIIAGVLKIKPIATGQDGEIKLVDKKRTALAALKRMVEMIGERVSDIGERTLIIAHCFDLPTATQVKDMILESYKFLDVKIQQMRGLCSFYALEKGIIVSF